MCKVKQCILAVLAQNERQHIATGVNPFERVLATKRHKKHKEEKKRRCLAQRQGEHEEEEESWEVRKCVRCKKEFQPRITLIYTNQYIAVFLFCSKI